MQILWRHLAWSLMIMYAVDMGAASLLVSSYDERNQSGQISVTAGQNSCLLKLAGTEKDVTCALAIPAGTQMLTVTSDFEFDLYRKGRVRTRGTQQVRIVDVNPLLTSIRDRSKPFGDRVATFLAARAKFDHAWPDLASEAPSVSRRPASKRVDIDAAEKRLGYALPAEYREMITSVGAVQIGDSSFEMPSDLATAYEQMVHHWGTDEADMAELPSSVLTFLRESTILFTEVGDGYGAMIYRPSAQKCDGAPAFYFVHEDELASAPHRITNADRTCGDYTAAFVWLVERFVLERYDSSGPDYVLIDSGTPDFRTSLRMYDADKGVLKFTAPWQ